MRSVLFHIFGIPVFAYGAAIATAFLVAVWHIRKLAEREGLKKELVYDSATAAMIAALVGARIVHVGLEWDHFRAHPGDIIAIWKGGLVFYGGLIACFLVLPFVFRAHGVTFFRICDNFMPAVALGHGFVRLGCFMNGCCYGKPARWGLVFPEIGDGVRRQPSQLYESTAGVVLFFILCMIYERRKFRGQVFLCYVLIYAAVRFCLEFTRDDPRGFLWGVTTSQWIAFGMVAFGLVMWPVLKKKYPLPETPVKEPKPATA